MTELELAAVRLRLFESAHGDTLGHLETLTQLPRGVLVHALQLAMKADENRSDIKSGGALTVFDMWLEWSPIVRHDPAAYENFVVWMRKRLEERDADRR